MSLKILNSNLFILNMKSRLPFKFGISTMTAVPHLILKLTVELEGQIVTGYSSDHLPPKWFTKQADVPLEKEVADMIEVITRACETSRELDPSSSVFSFWLKLYQAQREWAASTSHPPLLWGFGVSLVERAVIEAMCKHEETTFFQAVKSNLFGIRFGSIYPELDGLSPADILPKTPMGTIKIRHTVGLGDPITNGDISPAEILNDGLPQSLESILHTYRIKYLKIKISGDIEADFNRLKQIATVTRSQGVECSFTLDGNENYHDVEAFREMWSRLCSERKLHEFLTGLIFVEQPYHREIALSESVETHFTRWSDRPDIIIDESDGSIGDLEHALKIGYAGVSYKNCKGVFKGFTNAAYLHAKRSANPERQFILSSEDLSTVGPISLLQDLAALSTLQVSHSERNGHHYFKGLSMWSEQVQNEMLSCHPDLFRLHETGFPTLDIDEGSISLESVNKAPFGIGFELGTDGLIPLDEWNYAMLEG